MKLTTFNAECVDLRSVTVRRIARNAVAIEIDCGRKYYEWHHWCEYTGKVPPMRFGICLQDGVRKATEIVIDCESESEGEMLHGHWSAHGPRYDLVIAIVASHLDDPVIAEWTSSSAASAAPPG